MSLNKYNQAMAYLTSPEPKKLNFQLRESHGQMFVEEEPRMNFNQGGDAKNLKQLLNTDRKKFIEEFAKYRDKYFFGDLSAASRSIGENRNRIKAIFDRAGIKASGTGQRLTSYQVKEGSLPVSEFTSKIKKNPLLLNDYLKDNRYVDVNQLGQMFGIDVSNKSQRDFLTGILKKQGVQTSPISGSVKGYKVSDAAKKLTQEGASKKLIKGERLAASERIKIDPDPDLRQFQSNFNDNLRQISQSYDLYVPNAVEDIGHPVSIKIADKYPELFKNSDVLSIQNLVYQDPILNREILNKKGIDASYDKIFKQLNELVDQKVNPQTKKTIEALNKEMSAIRENALAKLDQYIVENPGTEKYLKAQKSRLPIIKVEVPSVGEVFDSKNLIADMSVVDDSYRVGNINKINKDVKSFAELNEKQMSEYYDNMIAQNVDNLKKYYIASGYPVKEVEDLTEYMEGGFKNVKNINGPSLGFLATDPNSINKLGDLARKIKPVVSTTLKVMGGEVLAGIPFAFLDYYEGRGKDEIIKNLLTLGFATPYLDNKKKMEYLESIDPKLVDAYKSYQKKLTYTSGGRGAGSYDPERLKQLEIQPIEKVAKSFEEKKQQSISAALAERAKQYEEEARVRETPEISDVEVPEKPFMDLQNLPEQTGVEFLGQTIAGEPRMEFDEGGPTKKEKINLPRRRVVQGIGMGIASIPLLGPLGRLLREGSEATTKVLAKTAARTAPRSNVMERFMMASKKLFDEGTPSYTKQGEIRIVHPDKNITYVEDVQSGHKHIEFETDKGTTGYIEFRPGESYIDEATGKGGISNPEVIDYEEVYRASGPDDYVKDIEEGLNDDILTSFDNFIGFKPKKE